MNASNIQIQTGHTKPQSAKEVVPIQSHNAKHLLLSKAPSQREMMVREKKADNAS